MVDKGERDPEKFFFGLLSGIASPRRDPEQRPEQRGRRLAWSGRGQIGRGAAKMIVPTKLWAIGVGISMALSAGSAAGQTLYAADNLTDGVLSGVVLLDKATLTETGSFLTGPTVSGLATDGSNVYVSQLDGISQYDSSGTLVGSYANIGIDRFSDLVLSGNELYAADNLTNGVLSGVVTLDTASLTELSSFLTAGHIAGLATNGADIFASLPGGISEYALDGTLVGSYANIGIDSFGALSFAGGTLYAADNLTNGVLSGVVMLDASLTKTGSFLTSGHVAGLVSDGTTTFASLPDGITAYDHDGNIVGDYANVGIGSFGPLALAAPAAAGAVPEPAAWTLFVIGFGVIGWTRRQANIGKPRTSLDRQI